MASVSRINGFKPVKHLNGAPYNGQANMYFADSGNSDVIMVGDMVKLAGDARSASGVPTVARHASGATEAALGVVVGIVFTGVGDTINVPPVTSLDTPVYRAASTNRYLMVADSPDLIFEAQTSGATFATANVGLNCEIDATAGSTVTGASGMSIDLAALNTTATLPLKVVGFPNRPDNLIGDAFTNAYVIINNHQLKGGTGTAGV